MRKRIYSDMNTVRRVQELCKIGTRPPVLRALFPSFPDTTITNIWVDVCGKRPPRGPLPYNIRSFLSNPQKRLETALVIKTFLRLRKLGAHDIDAMIGAYHVCAERLSESRMQHKTQLCFDRVWFICREYTSLRSIVLVRCPHCRCYYAHSVSEAVNHDFCPMHLFDGICGSKRAIRVNVKNRSSDDQIDVFAAPPSRLGLDDYARSALAI